MDGGDIGPDAVVSRSDDAIGERLREETVILNVATGGYVRLNATGSRIWEELARPATVTSLADRLQSEYGVDGPSAIADVVSFVRELTERGIVNLGS